MWIETSLNVHWRYALKQFCVLCKGVSFTFVLLPVQWAKFSLICTNQIEEGILHYRRPKEVRSLSHRYLMLYNNWAASTQQQLSSWCWKRCCRGGSCCSVSSHGRFLALGLMCCGKACPADCTGMFRMLCICVTELPNEWSICGGCQDVLMLCVVAQTKISIGDRHFGLCSPNEQAILGFPVNAWCLSLLILHVLLEVMNLISFLEHKNRMV